MAVVAPIISTFDAKGVNDAEKQFKSLEKKLKTALGVGALFAFGKAAIGAAEESAKAAARIEQVTKQMGLFKGETAQVIDRMSKYASTVSMATGVDDEQIAAIQAKLLTFRSLAESADKVGGAFDRTTKAALDLAAAGFGEAEGNALLLAKALEDPAKGLTKLERAIGPLTQAQRDNIRTLVEQNDIYGAQTAILAAVEGKVGGTAEATASASDKLAVAWDNLSEQVGTALLPAFQQIVGLFGSIVALLDALPDPVRNAILTFGVMAAVLYKVRQALIAMKVAASTANIAVAALAVAAEIYFAVAGDSADELAGKAESLGQTLDRLSDSEASKQFLANWEDAANNAPSIFSRAYWGLDDEGERKASLKNLTVLVDGLAQANLDAAIRVRDLLIAEGGHEEQVKMLTEAIDRESTAQQNVAINTAKSGDAANDATPEIVDLAKAHERVTKAAQDQLDAQLALISEELGLRSAQREVFTALQDYNDLQASFTDGTYKGENAMLDAATATDDFLNAALGAAAAADRQAKSVAEATGAQYGATEAARVQKRALEDIIETLAPDSPLRKSLLEYIGILENKIPKRITTQFAANISFTYDQATLARFPGLVQYRAAGGPVSSGIPYLVGENGPEMFTPSVGGYVSPTSRIGTGGKVAAGGGAVYNITVNGAVDASGTARQIRQLLQQDGQRLRLPTPVPA